MFDDDHFYMGGVVAEALVRAGATVTLVTPAPYVSDWTRNTLEQGTIHRHLASLGVTLVLNTGIASLGTDGVELACTYTDARRPLGCDAVVLVTSRTGEDRVYRALMAREAAFADAGILSVSLIGDAAAPAPIAWATFAGHRYARDLDGAPLGDALPFRAK